MMDVMSTHVRSAWLHHRHHAGRMVHTVVPIEIGRIVAPFKPVLRHALDAGFWCEVAATWYPNGILTLVCWNAAYCMGWHGVTLACSLPMTHMAEISPSIHNTTHVMCTARAYLYLIPPCHQIHHFHQSLDLRHLVFYSYCTASLAWEEG